jgi:hypothetical protein
VSYRAMNARTTPGRAALAADPAPAGEDSMEGRRRRANQNAEVPAATATKTTDDGRVTAVRRADRVRTTLCLRLRLDCNSRNSTAIMASNVGARIMALMA